MQTGKMVDNLVTCFLLSKEIHKSIHKIRWNSSAL